MSTPGTFDDQPIATVLSTGGASERITISPALWGFGGVHGGLTLALLTEAMRRRADGRVLRSVFAQFRRPLRDEVEIRVAEDGTGKTVSWLSAEASSKGGVAVAARATFSRHACAGFAPISPSMPSAPPPMECPVFTPPAGFVPFADRTQTRPVGAARPFAGMREPELAAWVRLVDDDLPPDEVRLMIFMDALPPSFGALLTAPVPIPTVTLAVTPGDGLSKASSPWVLLRARADVARSDGWHTERIDAWSQDGAYLGSAEQLRLVPSL
jgi:Thioesterase-like superfamily